MSLATPYRPLFGLLFVLIFSAAAQAEVSASLVANKVETDPQGQERLLPAERATPGDLIEYVVLYHNQGEETVRDLRADLPIPAGVELQLDSIEPKRRLEASVDGQAYAPFPLKRTHTLPDGRVEEQMVPASEYRHLRWTLFSLQAGEQKRVKARVKVSE